MPLPVDDADYCALASASSKAGHGVIPYNLAKGCYEMFPFDSRIRDNTLQSVHATLESFYVFYDIANHARVDTDLETHLNRSPPPIENSDISPVDLSLSLMTLGNTTFPTDYAFHSDLAHLIAQLQDPHTTYKSMCYQQFLFIQPLSTYGVYEDERHQVKIATVLNELDPRLSKALVDCEVTHIDGSPAFEVMTEYARTKSYSKDRGVRLNKAFSYLAHDRTGSAYDRYALGTFAQRTTIPPNATVEYRISCESKLIKAGSMATSPSAPAETTIELAWSALDATMAPYSNARSYRRQFCADDSIQTVKKFVLDSASADDFSPARSHLHSGRTKSRELFRGPYASFHMLSDGITAVFRLGTESPDKKDTSRNTFYANIDDGFAAMEAAGAKKLIIDLQNNSGGIICWGRYVLQTLFPHTVDAPYIYNLRASPLAQALARATFANDQDIESPYMGLVDPDTGNELDDESWMVPGMTLPGREGYFSNQVTDRYCAAVEDIKGSSDETPFKAENMVILTNGFCGSTCAVLALQLHERYGVRSVAIGGHHGESMAFTSFPGGAVQANNTLWVMSAAHPDKVSEYMRVPSEFRMDYTSARFRMPSILWEDVRREVWGASAIDNTGEDGEVVEGEDEEEEENGEQGEEEEGEDDDDHRWEGYGEETDKSRGSGTGALGPNELGATIVDTMGGIGLVAVVDDEMPDEELERAAADADREDLEWLERYDIFK
ncbi:hypothetical protein BGZ70_003238 [Mortierella alpina]|uniref:Tail specific protease domain-containing protein n=1 Tax=Mortierella alpina TaxID=64518 RepID=A0A9P6ISQ7_MORAP|nr:hypothetical protein BGZ70_003238 [Mortierella alpina]